MIRLYINEGYDTKNKQLLGEFSTNQEVAIAKAQWLEENGLKRAPFSRCWQTSDGEIFEDFGSWHYFFVTVEKN